MLTPDPRCGCCPKCGHADNKHVGGTCYACNTIDCMVILGRGNKWQLPPGWYYGYELNEQSARLPEAERPFLAFLSTRPEE